MTANVPAIGMAASAPRMPAISVQSSRETSNLAEVVPTPLTRRMSGRCHVCRRLPPFWPAIATAAPM
jgi:hypothetical protein